MSYLKNNYIINMHFIITTEVTYVADREGSLKIQANFTVTGDIKQRPICAS